MSVSALLLVASLYLPWIVFLGVVTAQTVPRPSQIVVKPIDWLRPDPNQPRKDFDPVALKALGQSMLEHGQLQPVGARPDGTLIWGERRYRAALEAGIKQLQVIITDRQMNDAEIRMIQLVENTMRVDLRPAERAAALAEIQKLNGWNNKELGQHVQMDASLVGRYLSLFTCIPSVQEAARADKLGVSAWYNISLLRADQQQAMLDKYLSGTPRDQIASLSRQKRNQPNATAGKEPVTRLRWQLTNGVQFVVSGELTFDQLIESLLQSAKAAKSARDQNIDAKTWTSMMKDQARKHKGGK